METNSFLDSISAVNNPATAKVQRDDSGLSKAGASEKRFNEDFDNFLRLLTTQLQNQDPTEPMDTNKFTEQLAVLSSVEQAISTNQNLETLVGIMQGSQISSAVSYIGKGVDAPGNGGKLENGQASFIYELPQQASEITATVLDSKGVPVFTGDVPATAGRHTFTWDGIGNIGNANGIDMPEGAYSISINAKDSNGDDIDAKTFTAGRVVAVESDSSGSMVLVLDGGSKVSLDKVQTVRELPPLVSPSSDNSEENNEA